MNGSFYGWYLKCQSDSQTLAVIPAVHRVGRKRTCSLQVITDGGVWTAVFPGDAIRRAKGKIYLGKSRFGRNGIRLAVDTPELRIHGALKFGPLSPLCYDVMGPFALVPFLECRHFVRSMCHRVDGTVSVNGRKFSFHNAKGYWEGDRGRSFPKEYAWTQCLFDQGSLMLSVADIPLLGIHFTGIIGVVWWKGREYRLATYLGARAVKIGGGVIRIVQGDLKLEARLLGKKARPLLAPRKGGMTRTIHESAASRAAYRFRKAGRTVFCLETDKASVEYEFLH